MEIVHSIEHISFNKKTVITIGMFDGIHRAHRAIIDKVVEKAKEINGRSLVITFQPHPKEVVLEKKRNIELLSTLDEKISFFESHNVDILFVIPFTYEFSRLSFEEFYSKYIINSIGVTSVIEGYNHQFGRDREGGMNQITELGRKHDFSVEAVPMITEGEKIISSSTVREYLKNGDIPLANLVLGLEYLFTGTVVRGHGRGKKLGYPTANIKLLDQKKLIPKIGVYAVHIFVRNVWYDGMMSIGYNPTFDDIRERTTEVNIFNFDMDIYDDIVTVRCIKRTRDEMKFKSVDDLVAAMDNDKIQTKNILKNYKLINQ